MIFSGGFFPGRFLSGGFYPDTHVSISGYHFSKNFHYTFQKILYILVQHIFFATFEGMGCLQIAEKDKAVAGPPNLGRNAFCQGLEISVHGFFAVGQFAVRKNVSFG